MSRGYRPKVSVMAAMARGRKFVDRGDLKGAIRCFERATELDPLCAQAFLYRAGLKLLAGDQTGALDDFRAIAKIDLAHLPAYRDLTTLSAEEFPGLIAATEKLLRRDPRCAWAHVFRAFSLRSLMRYEEAIGDLDRAIVCEPDCAALWAMRSRVKLTNRQSDYDGVRDMEHAVKLAPSWGWLHCWLGEALRHKGEFRRALRAFDRGLKLDPGYRRGFAWRGGTRIALGQFRDAIKDLSASLAWDPIYSYDFEHTADQKSWAYNQRMLAYRALGNIPRALRDLNRAHALGPRYAWVFNPSRDPGVYEAGIRDLSRWPRLVWARAWKGWTYHQAGCFEEALENLSQALRLNPGLAWVWAWKGKVLLSLNQIESALRCLDRALTLDPAYAPAWGWRGDAHRLLGNHQRAVSNFTRAIALDHRAAWAFAARGECRQKMGRLEDSLADLNRADAICPDYAEALAWRSETRRLAGDFKGALADANRALKLKPGLVLTYVTRSLIKGALKDFSGQIRDFRMAERLNSGLLETS